MDTQLELYNTSWLQSLVLYIWYRQPNCHSICMDGSQVHVRVRGLKATSSATWSEKLSDNHTTVVYVYYKTERRNCRC